MCRSLWWTQRKGVWAEAAAPQQKAPLGGCRHRPAGFMVRGNEAGVGIHGRRQRRFPVQHRAPAAHLRLGQAAGERGSAHSSGERLPIEGSGHVIVTISEVGKRPRPAATNGRALMAGPMNAMPRPLHLRDETTRHGEKVWYVRRGEGPRIRPCEPFGTKAFWAEYE